MNRDIRDLLPTPCDLVAFGEPTHGEPAFGWIRNELFTRLVDHGFRSIALETDRVAALTVNDFVQEGVGTLDAVMREGFKPGFDDMDTNRHLIAWMREYNRGRPPAERLAFHGFDASIEMTTAPGPRRYLEYARDYLGLDLDLAGLAGDDERWSRPEAVMDPTMSVGATAEAQRLRSIADDMLTALYARAPELIAATSLGEWHRAETYLTAGIGLLRCHWHLWDMDLTWFGAGAIVGSLVGERYTVIVGSLGRSEALGLRDPEPGSYEGCLQSRITTWGLTAPTMVAPARMRSDVTPRQGYFPLDRATIAAADAILHIADGAAVTPAQGELRRPREI